MKKHRSSKQVFFNFGVAALGLALLAVGFWLLSGNWAAAGFIGGFLLMTGIQVFCWAIGIRLEILGNLTEDRPRAFSDSDSSQRTSAIPQH